MYKCIISSNYNNFNIEDIVKSINIEDIKTYVYRQMLSGEQQYRQSDFEDILKLRTEQLAQELKNKGYILFDIGCHYKSEQEVRELKILNKKLQHNISQLQKQVDKLKMGANNG